MLAKGSKFTNQDYSKTLKKGRKISLGWAGIVYVSSPEAKSIFGLTIPTSAVPKAVQRNQIRRKIYSITRDNLLCDPKHQHKILVRVFKAPSEEDYKKLDKAIHDLLC